MRIVVPISTYLNTSSQFRTHLTALPQMLADSGSSRRVDAENYQRLRINGKHPVRLEPVALNETLAAIGDSASSHSANSGSANSGETVLLIPSPNFDATPYNNIVQAILYRNHALQATTLDCYGSVLAFLTEGIVSYCQRHRPTAEQLTLFVDSLREHLHAYVICSDSKLFEPTVHPARAFVAGLFKLSTVYGSETMAWKRLSMKHIGRTLKQKRASDYQVWIDSHNSDRYAKRAMKQLAKWGIAERQIAHNQLPHTSTSFPDQFALVTIAPNKQKVKMLAEWSLRWQELDA